MTSDDELSDLCGSLGDLCGLPGGPLRFYDSPLSYLVLPPVLSRAAWWVLSMCQAVPSPVVSSQRDAEFHVLQQPGQCD